MTVEEYHQRYAYLILGCLLRILGCLQLLLGGCCFACFCAYVHKDIMVQHVWILPATAVWGLGGGAGHSIGGSYYTGPRHLLSWCGWPTWIVTVILSLLG
ncbi:hypothetical protein FQN60_007295 [Etheostoma spectabile]|uniref:Uncharacterized protein n=1 Tax=Etheostoma spectabile TaxID=54343 RepID=A0A5J5CBN9_9PERO|nr:hypothetical protein FQN60_007295 [Etheostoma spectabile]